MERVVIKVHAGLHPADAACADSVRQAGAAMHVSGEPWLFHEFDLLHISFEGLYFPEDAALETCLPAHAHGKMDVPIWKHGNCAVMYTKTGRLASSAET